MANQSQSQKDPVCGMDVTPRATTPKLNYQDKQYVFCCQQCLNKFKQDPSQYT